MRTCCIALHILDSSSPPHPNSISLPFVTCTHTNTFLTVALAHQDHREVSVAFCGFATRAACAAKGRVPVSAQCVPALCRLLLRGPEGNLALVTALEEVVAVHMAREANLQASNLTGTAQSARVTVVPQGGNQ